MTAELTSEEIVTKLLTSNEILRTKKENFYVTNSGLNLGEFLQNLPVEEQKESPAYFAEDSKYTFIRF